jgi:hypothetical protein
MGDNLQHYPDALTMPSSARPFTERDRKALGISRAERRLRR